MDNIRRNTIIVRTAGPGKGPSDERGAALIAALLFLVMLTAIGMASVMTSSTETLIARNQRLNRLAMDHATAGLQAVMARMDLVGSGSSLEIGYNMKVKTIDDSGFANFSTAVSSSDFAIGTDPGAMPIKYSGYVVFKKEDGHHWRGKGALPAPTGSDLNRVVAYSKDCDYDEAPIRDTNKAFPVYEATITGRVMGPDNQIMASVKIRADITRNTINIYAPGGVFTRECPEFAGSPTIGGGTLPGLLANPPTPPDPPCTLSAPDNNNISGSTGGAAAEPDALEYPNGINMDDYLGFGFDELKSLSDVRMKTSAQTILTSPPGYGTYADPIITFWDNTDPAGYLLKISNLVGAGVLIVDGDIEFAGGMEWDGLIYVRGKVTFTGGAGGQNIRGSLMADRSFLGGSLNIVYDEAALENVSQKAFESKLLNWRIIYGYD